jgi:hypothetical protein
MKIWRQRGSGGFVAGAALVAAAIGGTSSAGAAPLRTTEFPPSTVTFNAAGQTAQHWTVPTGVTIVQYEVVGASGGTVSAGFGARLTGTLSVTPGTVLDIWVGLAGQPTTGGGAAGIGGWGGRDGLRKGGSGGVGDPGGLKGGVGGGGATEIDLHDGATNPIVAIAGGGGGSAGAAGIGCGSSGVGGCGSQVGGLGVNGSNGAGVGAAIGGGGGNTAGGPGGAGTTVSRNGQAGAPIATTGAGGNGGGGQLSDTGGGGGGGGYGGGGGGGTTGTLATGAAGGGSGRSIFEPTISPQTGTSTFSTATAIGNGYVTFSMLLPPAGATRFVPLSPTRLLDTRNANDITAGQPVTAGDGIDLQVLGREGVPATNVTAVVLNVTAAEALAPGFVTVWPSQQTRPTVSSLNVTAAGQNIANLVTVKVGANGKVSLFSQSGTHLVVDVAGYYEPVVAPVSAGRYNPLAPTRILDTRTSNGVPGTLAVPANGSIDVAIAGRGGVPATGVSAVVLNVTAAESLAAGFVTVWPTGLTRPTASNLNVTFAGQNIANLVIVPLGSAGQVSLYTQSGTHLVADVAGWFGDGTQPSGVDGLFEPLDPIRILDTRLAIGVATTTPVPPGGDITLTVAGHGVAPSATVAAAVLNVTAAEATSPGFVTVWPAATSRPTVSNLNVTSAGQNIANLVSVTVSPAGDIALYSQGGTHLVADIAGYYIG